MLNPRPPINITQPSLSLMMGQHCTICLKYIRDSKIATIAQRMKISIIGDTSPTANLLAIVLVPQPNAASANNMTALEFSVSRFFTVILGSY